MIEVLKFDRNLVVLFITYFGNLNKICNLMLVHKVYALESHKFQGAKIMKLINEEDLCIIYKNLKI